MEADIKMELSQHVQSRKRERSVSDESDRRKLVAVKKKLQRLEEDAEARAQRLAKDAARKARQRAKETPEEKAARLKRSAESRKAKLAQETPEERQIRLRKRAQSRGKSKAVKSEADADSSTDKETEFPQKTNEMLQYFKFIFDSWYNYLKSTRTDVTAEDEPNFVNKSFVLAYHYWLDSVKRQGGFNDQSCQGALQLFHFSEYSYYFWYAYFLNRNSCL